MNRVEIKEEAKKMIKGNLWYIWKPSILFGLILGLCAGLLGGIAGAIGGDAANIITVIVSVLSGIIGSVFAFGYVHYILEFVRGNRLDWKETLTFAKNHWVICLLVSIVTGFFVCLGMVVLVIPGIIISIGLAFYQEVTVDNPDLGVMDIVKKSWALTNGHKMDLFVFALSFIGWSILASLTLGLLFIWLAPYMIVAFALAYEKLRKTA